MKYRYIATSILGKFDQTYTKTSFENVFMTFMCDKQ